MYGFIGGGRTSEKSKDRRIDDDIRRLLSHTTAEYINV